MLDTNWQRRVNVKIRNKKIMMIALMVIISTMLLTATSFAVGQMDGYTWINLSEEAKEAYIEGIWDGMNYMLVSIVASFDPELDIVETVNQMKKEGDLVALEEEDYSTAIETIDAAYADEDNLGITTFELLVEEAIDIDEDIE